MVPTHILCHYGEIGTKGKNRRQFERKLKDNMKAGLKATCPGSYVEIRTVRGRIVIELSKIGKDSLETMKEVLRTHLDWFISLRLLGWNKKKRYWKQQH
jgi:adenylyl- and sulfurtransferase ThiI